MSQTRHFSSLRKRIEALFVPGLKLRVDCFAFANRTQWSEMKVPRYTVKLDQEIIWDFPRDLPIKDVSPYLWSSMIDISTLIRDYTDAPVAALTCSSFIAEQVRPYDHVGHTGALPTHLYTINLTPLFIAADRRIGKDKLKQWAEQWPAESAVHRILEARFAAAE
ncbi:MAG TPA: hypothetical protein PKD45_13515 [Flavobacteriales bacterium]|nr:hypothetical protein [Flavobacteriales bacterium]